jgi:thioredoxin
MSVRLINEQDFEREILQNPLPVLVDFYADWCGPCKAIAPLVEEASRTWAGRIAFFKVDVDRSPYLAQAFQVQSIPTLALLHNQRIIDMLVGAVDRTRIDALLQKAPTQQAALPGTVQVVEAAQAGQAVVAGELTPVDVRSEADFARVRLQGAVHVPLETLAEAGAQLQALGTPILLYGRTDEGLAEAARPLAERGLMVAVLKGGLLDWEGARLPVVRAAARNWIS